MPMPVRVRTLSEENLNNAYPRELFANVDNGNITIIKPDGSQVQNKNPGTLTLKMGSNTILNAGDLSSTLVVELPEPEVPATRTINGKALSEDIELTASDVGALAISGGTLTGAITTKDITVDGSVTINTPGSVSGIAVEFDGITSTEWTGDAAPYSQDIAIAGIRSTDKPFFAYRPIGNYATDTADEEALMSVLHRVTTDDGKITIMVDDKITKAVPFRLIVVR